MSDAGIPSSAVFTYRQFQSMLELFASQMPGTLSRMPETAHLSGNFDALLEQGSSPFTVAVMGQMRSGKSTLLNALMGRDLAITGVNETTATVNCFKYSARPEDCGRFRVVWKDAPEESVDINEIEAWIGDSQNAARTKRLVFYTESEFLKTANLVDTPGTRSTIADHTSALSDFLHDESVRQGGKADAIIYVLLPVGRENDEKWLAEFEKSSRMPGATPFNSLAVVHKWEATLDVDDPSKVAEVKADKIRSMLGGQVSCVIAVSAPLAIVADRLQHDNVFWESMVRLGRESEPEALNLITLSEDYFPYEVEGCSMTSQERQDLRSRATSVYPGLPWPSFKTIIRTAASPDILSSKDLMQRITEMSGFPALRKELQGRYFARARIIKAFGLLARAWKPAQTAQTILRNLKSHLDLTIREGDEVLKMLALRSSTERTLIAAEEYIRKSRSSLEVRFRDAQGALTSIGEAISPIQTAFEDMEREFAALEILDSRKTDYPPDILPVLHCLLGSRGTEAEARMKAINSERPTASDFARLCAKLRVLRRQLPPQACTPIDISIVRAEQIADILDS